ncbi:MAG: sulfurtransferase [Chloroflexota bacterium]
MYTTLIDAQTVAAHLNNPDWVLVDCRFQLADVAWGQAEYEKSHIPGAIYAHLDDDLSSPPITDNGRHPLPSPEAMSETFSRMGIDSSKQVVAYDNANGMMASRLWWMLRYMGHEAVAVLDGGWAAWDETDFDTYSGAELNPRTVFTGEPNDSWLVQIGDVNEVSFLVDSRAPGRYAGEFEPLDHKAGHIPHAVNHFFQTNWDENGRYLPTEQIKAQMEALLGDQAADEAVFYCGSGVSACVNLLALKHAGLGNGRLYAGSWSEWSRTDNPIETS